MEGNFEKVVGDAFDEMVSSNPVFDFKGEGPKRVLIMSGLPLSGKTYFVNKLNRLKPGRFLQVNSHTVRPVVVKHMGRKRPAYDKPEHEATFEVTHRLLVRVLENNWPVIADATNLREKYREWATSAARKVGAECVVVFMQVTDETAKQRLHERTSESSATYETFMQLKFDMEPTSTCSVPYIIIDSEVDISPHTGIVARWLSGESSELPGLRHPGR